MLFQFNRFVIYIIFDILSKHLIFMFVFFYIVIFRLPIILKYEFLEYKRNYINKQFFITMFPANIPIPKYSQTLP